MVKHDDYQVIVAGAGPAGLLLAKRLGEQGVSVAVYEPREETALGHDWSDAVEKSALAAAGFEIPEVVDGRYSGKLVKSSEEDDNLFEPHRIHPLQIRSPDLSCIVPGGVAFRYITTDRKALSRMLAEKAVEAGARIFYRHRVDRLLGENMDGPIENVRINGATVTDLDKQVSFDAHATVTVDATGIASTLRAGLPGAPEISGKFSDSDLAYAWRTVRRLDARRAESDDIVDHYRYGAYKGYFWTHRHHEDSIDVGGGVSEGQGRVDPRRVVEEMIAVRPSITPEVIRGGGGAVLVGKSPFSLVASGFMCVGDAAGQVVPTTGCGTGSAMTSALLAAGVISAALEKQDAAMKAMWPYNYVWFSGRGSHFAALSALTAVLRKFTHEDISFLMKKGIMNTQLLTPAINGVFETPGARDMLTSAASGIKRPGLLLKLNKATTTGKKIFRHYRNYPLKWDPAEFYGWTAKTRKLFGKL